MSEYSWMSEPGALLWPESSPTLTRAAAPDRVESQLAVRVHTEDQRRERRVRVLVAAMCALSTLPAAVGIGAAWLSDRSGDRPAVSDNGPSTLERSEQWMQARAILESCGGVRRRTRLRCGGGHVDIDPVLHYTIP